MPLWDGNEFELRMTSYELRSEKFRRHSPASMELFDVQCRTIGARLGVGDSRSQKRSL